MIATRYFHEYGLTMEAGKALIGKIAVKNHHNGSLAPKSHFKNIVTLEQVLKAPAIAYLLGLFDCCGNSDGSACAIVKKGGTLYSGFRRVALFRLVQLRSLHFIYGFLGCFGFFLGFLSPI